MLQSYTDTQIIVEISDRDIQGISLKRKALVQSISIELAATRVALNLVIKYYGKNEDESYADELNIPGITAYNKSLIADMTTLVDATNGIKLCDVADQLIDDEADAGQQIENPVLSGKTYMYEFEFFMAMMHQATVVADVATAKVQYAASIGQLD